jgi:tetratricopeptide (TPR) repeat protein
MIRSLQAIFLTTLAIAPLAISISPGGVVLAQTPVLASTCDPDIVLRGRLAVAVEQARSNLDRAQPDQALRSLQDAIKITTQVREAQWRVDLLQQWLLSVNEGYPTTRWQRLTQSIDRPAQATQLQTTLRQFGQLANQLTSAHSYVKTQSLAAIARYNITLTPNQPQATIQLLQQARQAATLIRGPIFTANALLDVADVYALMGETQSARTVLPQVQQAIQQIPPNTSEGLKAVILQRLATIYAQVGDLTTAQQLVSQFPDRSEAQSVALRGVVEALIRTQNLVQAEQLTQSITTPVQRIQALNKLAVAYYPANPTKVNQVLRQARQLAEATAIQRDPTLQDFVFKNLVETYLQVGQRHEALQLAKTALTSSKPEVLKSVMIAFSRGGETDVVESWLSEQLSYAENVSDAWERGMALGNVLRLAMDTQQFNWIRKEWERITAIDFGVQDGQMVQIATAYAATGQYAQAAQWVQQLSLANRPVLQVRLLAAIAIKAHQAGQTRWSINLLQQTLQQIDTLVTTYDRQFPGNPTERDRIKPGALTAIAVVYSQMGQDEQMRSLLQQVSQLDSSITNPSLGGPVDQPFAVFMDAEQYVGALQLALATRKSDVREMRLQASATALLQQNRFNLVLPVVVDVTEASRKTQLLLAIAQRYRDLQMLDAALYTLNRAFQTALTIPGPESLLDHLGADGNTVIEREDDRGSLLEAVALQYAQLRQGDRARQVASRLQDVRLREQVLQKIQCIARG